MVDVLLAAYNGEKYIAAQIDSVLWQTDPDWHLYIRDDGSTDGTVRIIEEYQERFPDKITIVRDQEPCGNVTHNFFRLLSYASGDYVMFADQDDIWYAHKLAVMTAYAKQYDRGQPLLLCSGYAPADEMTTLASAKSPDGAVYENVTVQKGTATAFNLLNNIYRGCTMCLNRALYSRLGNYDPRILMHDWWTVLAAGAIGEIDVLDMPLIMYRTHTANTVGIPDVGSVRYIWRKLHMPETRNLYAQYYDQAELLYERFAEEMDEPALKAVRAFIDMRRAGKLRRILLTFQNHFWKNSFLRRLGQLWYL